MNFAGKIHRVVPNGIAPHSATGTAGKPALDNSSSKREQFEATMLAHFDAAYTHARCLTGNRHDASDVVQESYLRALGFFKQLSGRQFKGVASAFRQIDALSNPEQRTQALRFIASEAPFDGELTRQVQAKFSASTKKSLSNRIRDAARRLWDNVVHP